MNQKQLLTLVAALTLVLSVGYRTQQTALGTVSKIYLVDSVLIRTMARGTVLFGISISLSPNLLSMIQ